MSTTAIEPWTDAEGASIQVGTKLGSIMLEGTAPHASVLVVEQDRLVLDWIAPAPEGQMGPWNINRRDLAASYWRVWALAAREDTKR